jgi:hypothetical protein
MVFMGKQLVNLFHIEVPPMPESKNIGWLLSIKTKLSG